VTQIAEVTRYDPEEKQVVVVDIFNFRNGVALQPTGYLPSFIDSLVEKELLDLEFLYGQEWDKPAAISPPPPVASLTAE